MTATKVTVWFDETSDYENPMWIVGLADSESDYATLAVCHNRADAEEHGRREAARYKLPLVYSDQWGVETVLEAQP